MPLFTKLLVCYSAVRTSRETSDRRRLEDGRRMQGVRRQRTSGYVQQFNDESSSIIICVVALPPIPFPVETSRVFMASFACVCDVICIVTHTSLVKANYVAA